LLFSADLINHAEINPKVRNLVATLDLIRKIDLEILSQNLEGAIYEPEQFPAGIIRLRQPYKTTILVFTSGKAVITGLKSSDWIRPVLQRLADIIKEPGYT